MNEIDKLDALVRAATPGWTVGADGNLYHNDFTHDAVLTLSGDWADPVQRHDFAQAIAALLNCTPEFVAAIKTVRADHLGPRDTYHDDCRICIKLAALNAKIKEQVDGR